MIEHLSSWINLFFLLTVIVGIVFFYFANGKPKLATGLIVLWAIIHSALAYSGFYQNVDAIPPRFALLLLVLILIFIYVLRPKQIQWMLANRNTKISTFLHTIRIPIEIALYYLFIGKMIPELMTFEGRNFDIIVGLTAPIIGLLWLRKKLSKAMLIGWNVIGLSFVIFIFTNGLLSAELPFQQFAFDQPNRAVIFFPFVLLPAVLVPLVVYTHITDIIKLTREK